MEKESYNIYGLIEYFNVIKEKAIDLAEDLMDVYPDVGQTSVDTSYVEMMKAIDTLAIALCCEGNNQDDGLTYFTTEEFYIAACNSDTKSGSVPMAEIK